MTSIHFVSGLPRSDSTLLAELLRQDPRFGAGMSGPLAGLFGALFGEMSACNEFSVGIDDVKRQRILHGLFDNLYSDCATDVAWCAWMPAITQLFPDTKVIACVCDLRWVIDSIERLIQRNVFSPSAPPSNLRRRRHSRYRTALRLDSPLPELISPPCPRG